MTEAIPGQQVQTLPGQGVVNRIMRGLLSTPLLSRLVGRRLVTLDVVGRKSGRHYYIPVAYTRHEGDLLIGSPFGWTRNLRTGEPVQLRLQGGDGPRQPQLRQVQPHRLRLQRQSPAR